jgi:hypothetical protein
MLLLADERPEVSQLYWVELSLAVVQGVVP